VFFIIVEFEKLLIDIPRFRVTFMITRLLALFAAGLMLNINFQAFAEQSGPEVFLPEEHRIETFTAFQSQVSFAKSSQATAAFADKYDSWNFNMGSNSSAPHRAWGEGIQIEGYYSINLLNSESAARRFVSEYSGVFHADPTNLRLLYTRIVNGKSYVKFIQQYKGLDVLFSNVDLRISNTGKVFMFGSDYHPNVSVSVKPTLGLAAAKEFAKVGLEYKSGNDFITGGSLVIMPVKNAGITSYHLVYKLLVSMNEDEVWDTYLDAHDGSILWRRNAVLHAGDDDHAPVQGTTNVASGRIMIKVFNTDPRAEEELLPCSYVNINFDGNIITTDADGRFSVEIGDTTFARGVARLSGPYSAAVRNDVVNPNDMAMMAVSVDANQELTSYFDESNSTSSERNGFYHTNVVSRWIRGLDASEHLAETDIEMTVNVNYSQLSCNANWDGRTINFYNATNSCRNTATLPSVIYHEYGHAINTFFYIALQGERTFNRAMEEANADITSAMLLDDPRIGLGMYKNSNEGLLRNCDNTNRYPDDFTGQIHADGMILTGAIWDTRERIGLERTALLTHYVKYGVPDNLNYGLALADYFIELLVADDDDADLSNGTPNSEAIIESFRLHGIPASGITITHEEISAIQSSLGPVLVQGTAIMGEEIAPDRIFVNKVKLIISTDDWNNSSTMDLDYDKNTGQFSGQIPAQADGTIVQYYFEAVDNVGSSVVYPSPAPSASYAVLVGFDSKYLNDMEREDNWTVSGTASKGNWVRENPVGTYPAVYVEPPYIPWVQPDVDHSKGLTDTISWVTGNTDPETDINRLMSDADVDDGATILTTSSFDLTSYKNPTLRYYRWYTNNAGSTPGQDSLHVRVSNDGGASWTDLEKTTETIANWTPRVFRLNDIIASSADMVFQFIAEDKSPGSLVEAALDDFELLDFEIEVSVEGVPEINGVELAQNFPNPFNPATSINFTLASSQWVSLKVYDLLGNEITTLASGVYTAGANTVVFDASSLGSGTYIYKLFTAGSTQSRRMILSK
jgi:type IX secretion system substrate protein/fungalysin/thermolysin propeptide